MVDADVKFSKKEGLCTTVNSTFIQKTDTLYFRHYISELQIIPSQ